MDSPDTRDFDRGAKGGSAARADFWASITIVGVLVARVAIDGLTILATALLLSAALYAAIATYVRFNGCGQRSNCKVSRDLGERLMTDDVEAT